MSPVNDSWMVGASCCAPAVILLTVLALVVRLATPRCPACGSRDFDCVDRRSASPDAVYHYRCGGCGAKFREPPEGGRHRMTDEEWAREVGG